MKIRHDFVTNSSSTSYIVYVPKDLIKSTRLKDPTQRSFNNILKVLLEKDADVIRDEDEIRGYHGDYPELEQECPKLFEMIRKNYNIHIIHIEYGSEEFFESLVKAIHPSLGVEYECNS